VLGHRRLSVTVARGAACIQVVGTSRPLSRTATRRVKEIAILFLTGWAERPTSTRSPNRVRTCRRANDGGHYESLVNCTSDVVRGRCDIARARRGVTGLSLGRFSLVNAKLQARVESSSISFLCTLVPFRRDPPRVLTSRRPQLRRGAMPTLGLGVHNVLGACQLADERPASEGRAGLCDRALVR
jgi:hypothetical protein